MSAWILLATLAGSTQPATPRSYPTLAECEAVAAVLARTAIRARYRCVRR